MPTGYYVGPPGITPQRAASHRLLFLQDSETFLAQGRLIDGTKSRDPGNTPDVGVLRAGLLMGKITANKLYAPAILGGLLSPATVGATSLTVSPAVAVELVRRVGTSGTFILRGPPTANGTIASETVTYSAINTTTGVITCTATNNAYVAGSFVQPTDSTTPLTLIHDGYGIPVLDLDGNSVASVDFAKVPISGVIDASQVLPAWPTDTSLQSYIVASLNGPDGGQYVFDSRFL